MLRPRCSSHKDRDTFPEACQTCRRIKIEQEIVEKIVDAALAAGYRLAVSLERGYDIEDMVLGSVDKGAILEAAFAGDECHIFVQDKEGPTVQKKMVISEGFIFLVFGNDGYDVINDYSQSLEDLLKPINEYCDSIMG